MPKTGLFKMRELHPLNVQRNRAAAVEVDFKFRAICGSVFVALLSAFFRHNPLMSISPEKNDENNRQRND